MKKLIRKIYAQKIVVFLAAALAVAVIFGMVMTSTQDVSIDQGAVGHGHTH